MWWIVGILVFIGAFILMLALCKVAAKADREIEERLIADIEKLYYDAVTNHWREKQRELKRRKRRGY